MITLATDSDPRADARGDGVTTTPTNSDVRADVSSSDHTRHYGMRAAPRLANYRLLADIERNRDLMIDVLDEPIIHVWDTDARVDPEELEHQEFIGAGGAQTP